MPKELYDLASGIDNNNLLNLQIDTFERMNQMERGLNIPKAQSIGIPQYQPFIPKDIDTDTLITGKDTKLPTIKDALNSADPKIVDAAWNTMQQVATKNPEYYGVGTDQYLPYVEGQNKFTNHSFFKSAKQTKFGYNPYVSLAENENFYHENVWNSYTNVGKLWRTIGITAGRALSKAVTGLVGMVGDLGSMVWNGLEELNEAAGGAKNNFWYDVSNNGLAREMEKWDNHVKEQWLPTYKALNYDNKGAFQKLVDPYTWTNSFADGIGFLAQFAIPGAAFGKLGQAGKLARSIGAIEVGEGTLEGAKLLQTALESGKTIAQIKNVNPLTYAMGYDFTGGAAKVSQFLTGSENVGGISAHLFSTTLESVQETKQGVTQTVQDLMAKGMSKDEAIKKAGENAPTQFWLNMGILSISNAFENKFLQKAVGNRPLGRAEALTLGTLPEVENATTKLGKFFTANKWGNRINFYGTNAAKATLFEGFWEENAQNAASRYAAGEYDRQGKYGTEHEKVTKTFFGQLLKQTKDAFQGNDIENADSIMAGAVIGVLGTAVFSKLAGQRGEIRDAAGTVIKLKTFLPEGERKALIREKAQKVATFINTRDAWLSINTLDASIYDKDSNLIPEAVKAKTEEIREKIAKINSTVAENITADDIVNPDLRDRLQYRLFASYVKAHILNDTGNALINRLKDWKEKPAGELALYGVSTETKEDAQKWVTTAEDLVKAYDKIKDKRYAAPSNTKLTDYQNITNAIHSLIFDYTAYRNMSQNLSDKYKVLMNDNNPFSEHPMLQDYNENQVKLLKLKQKLENENLDPLQREYVNQEIEDVEKQQKQRKEDISALGDSIESSEGLFFPKDTDKLKESERIAQYPEYFDALNNKVDHDILSKKYDRLIKDYSNEATGYAKFVNTANHWDEIINKDADTKVAADVVVETKKTKDILEKQIEDLQNQLQIAATKVERDTIQKDIADKKEQIAKINEELDSSDTTTNKDEEDLDDVPPPPDEVQYGTDEYVDQVLAFQTPFKLVNRETIDPFDDNNKIWWKEIVLEHGYDHDLTAFNRFYLNDVAKFPDKYELFVIKDTPELMQQRLSKAKLAEFDEGKFKAGAIVVFKEKGKDEYLKFPNGKIIASSYNETAFYSNYDERVIVNARNTDRTIPEVLEFFKQEQAIADAIREDVITNNSIHQIKSESGSLGVFPTTTSDNVFTRFEGFGDKVNPITIVKLDNKNQIKGAVEGQVYFNIPESNTVSGRKFYIPVYATTIQEGAEGSIQKKIYNSLQVIQHHTFKNKKEAYDLIRNYLYNFFYTSETNYFKVNKVKDGFKIVYIDKDGEHTNWLNTPRLKVLDELYNTEKGFSLYNKKDGVYQPTENFTKQQYQDFIHNHLVTRRKVVVQNIAGKEKIYSEPVNAYLNLAYIGDIDVLLGNASKTTENTIVDNILTNEEEILTNEEDLTDNEQKAIAAFQDKTFVILKPYTNILQDEKSSLEDKRSALKSISDQMLAPATAERVGDELKKELGILITDLNYPAPIENSELSAITDQPTSDVKIGTTGEQLVVLKEKLIEVKSKGLKALEIALSAKISQLEEELKSKNNPLQTEVNNALNTNLPITAIIPHTFEGNSYRIDFDNDTIEGVFPDKGKEFASDFQDSFIPSIFIKSKVEINGLSYYFVKHKELGKFVTFDENMKFYKISELPQAVKDSEELKKIEDCK